MIIICCLGIVLVSAIEQTCQSTNDCPANAECLSSRYCGCNAGFVGSCNTKVTVLSNNVGILSTLDASSTTLFQVYPDELNNYI